jgi:DNA-binding PadR family transcriptional regulator
VSNVENDQIAPDDKKKAENLVDTWISRYRRGSLRFFILHLLQRHHIGNSADKDYFKQHFHGYKIAKKIKDVTKGKWHPTTASIYPILKELTEVGVITKITESEDLPQDSSRQVIKYKLTDFGVLVAQKLQVARKEFAKAFITRRTPDHPPPPPFFGNLSKTEIKETLEESDRESLEKLKTHQEKILKHHQKLLDLIDESIRKLE